MLQQAAYIFTFSFFLLFFNCGNGVEHQIDFAEICDCIEDLQNEKNWKYVDRRFSLCMDSGMEAGLLKHSKEVEISLKEYDLLLASSREKLIDECPHFQDVYGFLVHHYERIYSLRNLNFKMNAWDCQSFTDGVYLEIISPDTIFMEFKDDLQLFSFSIDTLYETCRIEFIDSCSYRAKIIETNFPMHALIQGSAEYTFRIVGSDSTGIFVQETYPSGNGPIHRLLRR